MPPVDSPETQLEATPQDAQPLSTPPPAGLEKSSDRWGSDAPELLRGKNANETIDIVSKLTMAIQQLAAAPQPTQETMPQPAAAPIAIDDDLLVTNPAEWRRQFQASVAQDVNATLQAAATPIFASQAATAETLSRNDAKNKDVASKWWDEVTQMVAPIPAHMRSQALYDQAARMARSNHVDEIATEKAAALGNAGTGLEGAAARGTGSPALEGTDASWDKIAKSAIGKKMIDQYGKNKVLDTAKKMNLTLDKYADMVAGSKTLVDPEKPGTWYTDLGSKVVSNG